MKFTQISAVNCILLSQQYVTPFMPSVSLRNFFFSPYSLFQQSHLFDNEGTVFFAIFMGIWGKCQSMLFLTEFNPCRRSNIVPLLWDRFSQLKPFHTEASTLNLSAWAQNKMPAQLCCYVLSSCPAHWRPRVPKNGPHEQQLAKRHRSTAETHYNS